MSFIIDQWKVRVAAAIAALGSEKVLFATSLQDRCVEYAKFHDHTGQHCTIVSAIIEPSADYDEESLPYYVVRFDDGVEVVAGDEELFSKSDTFFAVMTAVSGAFAVSRDLDFVGPTHLCEEGDDAAKRSFEERFAAYSISTCAQNFNTPKEFAAARLPTMAPGIASQQQPPQQGPVS